MPLDGMLPYNQEPISQTVTTADFLGEDKPYLIVAYGLGRDSTALLIRLVALGIRPDLIIFCDLGSEKEKTYAYLPIMNAYLKANNFPEVTVIQLKRRRDVDFEAHLLRLAIFPTFNYGRKHTCSATWKCQAQDDHLEGFMPVVNALKQGRKVVRAVGFEDGEQYRIKDGSELQKGKKAAQTTIGAEDCSNHTASAFAGSKHSKYLTWFPLIEWGLDFDGVIDTIFKSGQPLCPKSSCTFCPAMRPEEVADLALTEPHNFFKCLVLERLVQRNKIVPHEQRVQGLRFGAKWSDYDCAAPFRSRVDEVIELFKLDRTFECGDRDQKSLGWKKKAAKVELFRATFSTADNLRLFMANRMDLTAIARKVAEIETMDVRQPQMALPI